MVFGILAAGAFGGIVGGMMPVPRRQQDKRKPIHYISSVEPDDEEDPYIDPVPKTLDWIQRKFHDASINFSYTKRDVTDDACILQLRHVDTANNIDRESPTFSVPIEKGSTKEIIYENDKKLIQAIGSHFYNLVDDSKKFEVKQVWIRDLLGFPEGYIRQQIDETFWGFVTGKKPGPCAPGYTENGDYCRIDYNSDRWDFVK
jgi:hypothetical protein